MTHVLDDFQLHPGLRVVEVRLVLLLFRGEVQDLLLLRGVVLHDDSVHLEVFPHNQSLDGPELEALEGVVHHEAILARVLADLVKVLLE